MDEGHDGISVQERVGVMFKFKILSEDLDIFLAAVSAFCREGNLEVSESRLKTVLVDAAGVALVEVEVPIHDLQGGPFVVALAWDKLQLAAKKQSGEVEVTYDDGLVKIKSGRAKYNLQTLVGVRPQKVPTVPSKVRFKIDPGDFAEGVHAVGAVADKKDLSAGVWFVWNNGQLVLKDKEQLLVEVEYEKGDVEVVSVEGVETCRTLVSKEYAEGVVTVMKKLDVCLVAMGQDVPLVVLGKNDRCKVGFVVAPRIEVS